MKKLFILIFLILFSLSGCTSTLTLLDHEQKVSFLQQNYEIFNRGELVALSQTLTEEAKKIETFKKQEHIEMDRDLRGTVLFSEVFYFKNKIDAELFMKNSSRFIRFLLEEKNIKLYGSSPYHFNANKKLDFNFKYFNIRFDGNEHIIRIVIVEI